MSDSIKDNIIVSELVSRYLECPICVEEYDDSNVPKQLPCQHTYCSDCLYKLPKRAGSITCPQCKQDHKLESDVSSYPRDLTRGDLMDFIRTKIACKCDKCEKTKADYNCLTCAQALCNMCKVRTHGHRSFQHHRLKPIIKNLNHTDDRCKQDCHDNGVLKFFCMGCMQILCAQGVLEEHRNEELHQVVAIEKAYRNYKSQIDDIVTRMKLEIAFIKLQNKCIVSRLRYQTCNEDELIQWFNVWHTSGKIPADREEECQKFCSHVCKGRVATLRNKMKRCEKGFEQLKKIKTRLSKTVVESKDISTFLSKMKRIQYIEQDFQIALQNIKNIMNQEVDPDVSAVVTGGRQVQEAVSEIVPHQPALPIIRWIRVTVNTKTARRRAAHPQDNLLLVCSFIFSCILLILWIDGAAISAPLEHHSRHLN
ncbi:E3 ubiquitin-protein ligase TRIM56 [Mizuhopecten yessoensis]|uniref:E3 ubiquitin-protein ligase TRIM56 n=1 Tax=Mizuhopecten yessoensis TaxID=6573 RepID=A0A210QC98_MIZYE|nr:E3 ubiquitin-protein ligase TRIM56 [Mizuhopecten yessoensis]